ncbi:MAG: NAD-dependent epimerase/dehydratase family protein, partial [Bdellovibrionales bacterium]|nr:NAD-dependent epimerase/dehydratase family protein [Bdellovibrionales bacterium]
SGAVYGDGSKGFDDTKPSTTYTPLNPYGESKRAADIWIEEQTPANKPTHWYGLRFFNVYGPNEYHKGDMASVVYKAFLQVGESGRLRLFRSHNPAYDDGHQMRDFVYIRDICSWMIDLYESKSVQSGIYNLGYGKARTWLDLATQVFKSMDRPLDIDWIDIPESIRNQYQYFTKAEMSKLLSQGLKDPQWPLESGVEEYVEQFLMKDQKVL